MKALMKIPNLRPPSLSTSHKWTKTFQDFLRQALQKNPKKRPRAMELSTHLFIQKVDDSKAKADLLQFARQVLPPLPDDDVPEWFNEEDSGDGFHIDTMLFDKCVMCVHARLAPLTHTHTHTLTHSHTHTHSLTHSRTHTHTHNHSHIHTHTHIRTISLTHSLTHTLTHSLTHTRIFNIPPRQDGSTCLHTHLQL